MRCVKMDEILSRLTCGYSVWELKQLSQPMQQKLNDAFDAGDLIALTAAVEEAIAELDDLRERLRLEKEQKRTALVHRAFPSLTYEDVRELAKIMKEMHP